MYNILNKINMNNIFKNFRQNKIIICFEIFYILFFIIIFKIENKIFNTSLSIRPLKFFIKLGGPLPIKLGQLIINKHKMKYFDNNMPLWVKKLDSLLYETIEKKKYNEKELIMNYPELKNYYNFKMINSGSIGSIFLIQKDNKEYILKLQHQNIYEKTKKQLQIIKFILSNKFIKKYVFIDFEDIKNTFLNQFDFIFEAKKQLEFYNIFKEKEYIIPNIYDYDNYKIIMDYIPMRFITDENLKYHQKLKIIIKFQVFLKYMFLKEGLLHLDLHTGNWGLDENNELVILDFGYSLRIYDKNDLEKKEVYSNLWSFMILKKKNEMLKLIIKNFMINKKHYTDEELFDTFLDYSKYYNIFDSNNLYSIIYNFCNKFNILFSNELYFILYYLNFAMGISTKYLNINKNLDLLEGEDYYNSYKIVFSYEDTVFEQFPSISCKEENDKILNELKNNLN